MSDPWGLWKCDFCSERPIEAHWNWPLSRATSAVVVTVCATHIATSRDWDEKHLDRIYGVLYLPIVQPVMGSDEAIAMEAAMFAVGRLLLLCKRHDGTQAERDEAEQTLAVLRAAQAEAWLRRAHREAA